MNMIPVLLSASYTKSGQSILLKFNTAIQGLKNYECSQAFDQETLKWLPPTRTCRKLDASTIEVNYDSQKGILEYLTINNNSFYKESDYSVMAADSKTVRIDWLPLVTEIIIKGHSSVSECDSIDLFAVTNSIVMYPLHYKWNIEYTDNLFSKELKAEFDKYLTRFTDNFSSNSSALTIPYYFLKKGNTLKIKVFAKTEYSVNHIESSLKEIKVYRSTPKIRFMAQSKSVIEVKGNSQINLPLQIDNIKCQLQSNNDANLQVIRVETLFVVKSGKNASFIDTYTEHEKSLEQSLAIRYSKFKAIIAGNSGGFKYNIYYNITAIGKDMETGATFSDSVSLIFVKPDIQSKVEISDTLVSINSDVKISAASSYIPDPDDDTVNYFWTCINAETLSAGLSCICPILSDSAVRNPEIKIPKEKLTAKCKYKFSISISAASKSTGMLRTAYSDIEFFVHGNADIQIKPKICERNNEVEKDMSFSVALPNETNSKAKPLYQWTLIEAESIDPQIPASYSTKGSFLFDFLTNTLNMDASHDLKNFDKNFTDNAGISLKDIEKSYLTKLNSSILGIDKSKLKPDFKYTFSAVITQDKASTLQFVSFVSQPSIKPRVFSVNPSEGIGFETTFTFTFTMALTNTIDTASYQILRKNCPDSDNPVAILTEKITFANSYTMILAPGLKSCDFKVEFILRVFEHDNFADFKANITVKEPSVSMESAVKTRLSQLKTNSELTFDQKFSLLSELSRVSIVDSPETAKLQLDTIYEEISAIDAKDGILDFVDNKTQCDLIISSTEILSNLIASEKPFLNSDQSTQLKEKIESNLIKVSTKQGGTYIIPSTIAALSNLTDIEKTNYDDTIFFKSMQNSLSLMRDMKLDEMIIGSPAFYVTSPSIQMIVEKMFVDDYKNGKQFKMEKNESVYIPPEISKSVEKSLNTSGNNSVVIGTSVYSTNFNPFKDIKLNANISTNHYSNLTNSNPFINNNTITQIYESFKKENTKKTVDSRYLVTPVVQFSVKPYIFESDFTPVSLPENLSVELTLEDDYAVFALPILTNISQNINDSLLIPFHYISNQEIWTNENCTLDPVNITDNTLVARCNHIDKKEKVDSVMDTFALSIDVVKDVYKIIQQGNYDQLLKVGSLLDLNQRNIIAFSVIGVAYSLIICGYILLASMDKHGIYDCELKCLTKYFNKETKIVQTGALYRSIAFLNKLKQWGAKIMHKKIQDSVSNFKKQSSIDQLHTQEDLVAKSNKKNPIKMANGFSVLSLAEKTELWDFYQMYTQCSKILENPEEVEEVMSFELAQSPLMVRMTQYYVDDIILLEPVTFWSLFKSEHPLLNAVMKAEITTPRPIKLLIFFCTLAGELFITGYFKDADTSEAELATQASTIINRSCIISLAAAALMIPLKIFISLFMTGTTITKSMSREQIAKNENLRPAFKIIGIILGFSWLTACFYGIMMFIITFSSPQIDGWMLTFGISVFIEIILVAQIKIFVKVLIGILFLRLMKSQLMISAAGLFAGFLVEWIVAVL